MGRNQLARGLHRAFQALEPGERGFTSRALLGGRAKIGAGAARTVPSAQQASLVVPATKEADDVHHGDATPFRGGAPQVAFDHFGAISMVTDDAEDEKLAWRNEDGKRHEDGRYAAFAEEISAFIPSGYLLNRACSL